MSSQKASKEVQAEAVRLKKIPLLLNIFFGAMASKAVAVEVARPSIS